MSTHGPARVLADLLASASLRCPLCNAALAAYAAAAPVAAVAALAADLPELVCPACGHRPAHAADIVDLMPEPSADVQRELAGMVLESADKNRHWSAYKLQRVERVSAFADRLAESAKEPFDYYGSTLINFNHAVELIGRPAAGRCLEVGGDQDCPFSLQMARAGMLASVANIYHVHDGSARDHTLLKFIADMHRLPFADNSFDLVFASACTHHSHDLAACIGELARVCRPGGRVLILNDPTDGLLKHAGDAFRKRPSHDRNALVHENEYTSLQYHRLLRAAGLRLDVSFFTPYYEQRLQQRDLTEVRLGLLARVAALLWKHRAFRSALHHRVVLTLLQRILGLQINLIATKPIPRRR